MILRAIPAMRLRSFTAAVSQGSLVLALAGCTLEPSLCVEGNGWWNGPGAAMAAGSSMQMRAGKLDILDECDLPPPRGVVWSSSDATVLRVDNAGIVHAQAPGTADVIARYARAETRFPVTVVPAVARIEITPRDTSITVGDTVLFRATAYGMDGAALPGVSLLMRVTEGPATYPGKGATPAFRAVYDEAPRPGSSPRHNEVRALGTHRADGLVIASLVGRVDSATVRLIWGRMPR